MPVKEPQTRLDGGARDTVLVDLALQGGGSHGAFTWGVLDRLMDEPWLRIDGISGTSAGAKNAVVLAGGFFFARRPRRRQVRIERLLAASRRFGAVQPHSAKPFRCCPRPLDA